jgi:hypothetical protein
MRQHQTPENSVLGEYLRPFSFCAKNRSKRICFAQVERTLNLNRKASVMKTSMDAGANTEKGTLAAFMAKARLAEGLSSDELSKTGNSAGSMKVQQNMLLSEPLRKNAKGLRDIPLIPLNCTFGVVNEKGPRPLKTVLRNEAKLKRSDVSVVFVVRRPGCVSCREHGQQLSGLANEDPSVAFWAIVKETGIEEKGILTFYDDYFHFPIYKDEKWSIYKAMGERTLTPFKLLKRCLAARPRWVEKGIPNRIKGGDIWVQGGVLLFKKGKLRYAYEEEYGKELAITDIRTAIKSLQFEEDERTYTCTEVSDSSFLRSFPNDEFRDSPSFVISRIEI